MCSEVKRRAVPLSAPVHVRSSADQGFQALDVTLARCGVNCRDVLRVACVHVGSCAEQCLYAL
eukprot:628988-Prorocentrum_minimum.AAC.1